MKCVMVGIVAGVFVATAGAAEAVWENAWNPAPTASAQAVGLVEDFEDYAAEGEPLDWLDTGSRNSLGEDDSLFEVMKVTGTMALGTSSTATNIHSHFVGVGSDIWSGYVFTGRLRVTSNNSSIGVNVLSDYPNSDAYYRLRRTGGGTFHIAPHPWNVVDVSEGVTDTGVKPSANKWYWFAVEVTDEDTQTRIRAKVWQDGKSEPAEWQVDCIDAHANRLTAGTVGVWSSGSGTKYWDDLEVRPVSEDPPVVEPTQPVIVCAAEPTTGAAPLSVSFAAAGDKYGVMTEASYAWAFGDGSGILGKSVDHQYRAPGSYVATLWIEWEGQWLLADSVTIVVTEGGAANVPPSSSFSATPMKGVAPLLVEFDGRASSDSDGDVTSWAWEFGNGFYGWGPVLSHLYTQPGSYEVKLAVKDNDGAMTMSDVVTIVVESPNTAPAAQLTADVTTGTAPLTVTFDGSGSWDSDGSVASYAWDFGDGTSGEGVSVSHTYEAGTYEAVLTVTDDDGASAASRSLTIIVDEPAVEDPVDPVDPSDDSWPGEPPAGMEVYSGNLGSLGWNPIADQQRSWWVWNADVNGNGADAAIYCIGSDSAIVNAKIYGGKHGIRIASVNGLHVANCEIVGSGIKGSGIKLCGIGNLGPASRNVVIEDCDITGRVTIKPQNRTNAMLEKLENITLRNCTIRPFGNTGVRVAAKNVRLENVTVDFRNTSNRDVMAFVVTDYYGCKPENVTITNDCKMLTNSGQNPTLIYADIPINRE